MNSQFWLTYFQNNREARPEPQWNLPTPDSPLQQRVLARSLSHFQLGESGEGRCLLKRAAREAAHDPTYQEALRLFLAEEHEHARLLAGLVQRLGGNLITKHWTHSLFRFLRRLVGLNFELQVLVTAELIGTAYYRVLHRRTHDPVVEQCCALFLRDEAQHIAFHRDHFNTILARLLPIERAGWMAQFQGLFAAALQAAWLDHRDCLVALGARKAEFIRVARQECIALLAAISPVSADFEPESQRPPIHRV